MERNQRARLPCRRIIPLLKIHVIYSRAAPGTRNEVKLSRRRSDDGVPLEPPVGSGSCRAEREGFIGLCAAVVDVEVELRAGRAIEGNRAA